MKILYIELINFIGVKAAMHTDSVKFDFGKIDKPIIQIYGKNGCGKTVLAHQLHPFSNINLNGDERNELSLIIPKETGIKRIGYLHNGDVYNIEHTYTPTRSTHTVSSSITKNGVELNQSGGVNTFNSVVERELGINRYIFQFVINGTQITSFGNMSDTQRKNVLYKAMGMDIYDKIHKMSTDDYRYTSKLITALNNSKEFLLSTYGTYDNLCTQLSYKENQYASLSESAEKTKSGMDKLYGTISSLKKQNISEELNSVTIQIDMYDRVIEQLGSFDASTYDSLIDKHISMNDQMNNYKTKKMELLKDMDVLRGKKSDIQTTMLANKRALDDYNEMVSMKESLTQKIKDIELDTFCSSPSSYIQNMLNLAQVINSTCKEIRMSLNDNLLKLLTNMLIEGIDINGFLLQEGSVINDSEKERSAVIRLSNVFNSVIGDIKQCEYDDCLYKKSYNMMDSFFKSYQSSNASEFTAFDIEQIQIAYKSIQTIRRLINVEIAPECKKIFTIESIAENMSNNDYGIDISIIHKLMQSAADRELRDKYIQQLSNIERSIESIENIVSSSNNEEDIIVDIDNKLNDLSIELSNLENDIRELSLNIADNSERRSKLQSVKNINISELRSRLIKLTKLSQELHEAEEDYNILSMDYNSITTQLKTLEIELNQIKDTFNQYNKNIKDIDRYLEDDKKFKIISEATSPTKGKPVLSIRDKVQEALLMTNRLLDIIYDGEIEMLDEIIDEHEFSLPFRRGTNVLSDIKFGSQSESSVLSLALSLSLESVLTFYDIPVIDEKDAYMDAQFSDAFVMMLNNIMSTLKMEQLFIISHKMQPGQYNDTVYVLDLPQTIAMM